MDDVDAVRSKPSTAAETGRKREAVPVHQPQPGPRRSASSISDGAGRSAYTAALFID